MLIFGLRLALLRGVKIALQLTSLISTAKSAVPPASADSPDFHSALTAAVESNSARSKKSPQIDEVRKKPAQSDPQLISVNDVVPPLPSKTIANLPAQQPVVVVSQNSTSNDNNQGTGSFQLDTRFTNVTSTSLAASSLTEAPVMPAADVAGSEAEAISQIAPQSPSVTTEATPTTSQTDSSLSLTAASAVEQKVVTGSVNTPSDAGSISSLLNVAKLPAVSESSALKGVEVTARAKMELSPTSIPHSQVRSVTENPQVIATEASSPAANSANLEVGRTSDKYASKGRASGDAASKAPEEGQKDNRIGAGEGSNAAQAASVKEPNTNNFSIVTAASPISGLQKGIPSTINGASSVSYEETATSKFGSPGGPVTTADDALKSGPETQSGGTAQIALVGTPPNGKVADSPVVVNPIASTSQDPAGLGVIAQPFVLGQGTAPSHTQSGAQGSAAADTEAAQAHTPNPTGAVPVDTSPSLSSAQLIQSMHHSEMRLGMQSEEFGSISISTSLNHQALSAQISIDHSELSRALAVHLPSIEEKLGNAYGVQARVEVRDAVNSNTSSYSNSGQQSKENRESRGGTPSGSTGVALERMNALPSSVTNSVAVSSSRLDIRI
jgi:hypothetical protein